MTDVGHARRSRKPSTDRWQYQRTAPTPGRVCKDCKAESGEFGRITLRPAPHPGPRCASHHKEELRRRRLARKERRITDTYSITPEQYDALYAFQGGRCALCRRATGASKRLAVDHDHKCCSGARSCGKCVRGLVCSTCNDVLAHFRDSPDAFARCVSYLEVWPSRRAGITLPRDV